MALRIWVIIHFPSDKVCKVFAVSEIFFENQITANLLWAPCVHLPRSWVYSVFLSVDGNGGHQSRHRRSEDWPFWYETAVIQAKFSTENTIPKYLKFWDNKWEMMKIAETLLVLQLEYFRIFRPMPLLLMRWVIVFSEGVSETLMSS